MQTKNRRNSDGGLKQNSAVCRDPSAPSTGDEVHNSQGKPQRDLLGNVVTASRFWSPPMLESDGQNE